MAGAVEQNKRTDIPNTTANSSLVAGYFLNGMAMITERNTTVIISSVSVLRNVQKGNVFARAW